MQSLLKRLFRKPERRTEVRTRRLRLEPLESRELLSAAPPILFQIAGNLTEASRSPSFSDRVDFSYIGSAFPWDSGRDAGDVSARTSGTVSIGELSGVWEAEQDWIAERINAQRSLSVSARLSIYVRGGPGTPYYFELTEQGTLSATDSGNTIPYIGGRLYHNLLSAGWEGNDSKVIRVSQSTASAEVFANPMVPMGVTSGPAYYFPEYPGIPYSRIYHRGHNVGTSSVNSASRGTHAVASVAVQLDARAYIRLGEAPIAEISAPSTVAIGDAALLKSLSYDPDNGPDNIVGQGILDWKWTITDPLGEVTTLSGPDVGYGRNTPGLYSVTLTVTDDEGMKATAEASFVVTPPEARVTQVAFDGGYRQHEIRPDPVASAPLTYAAPQWVDADPEPDGNPDFMPYPVLYSAGGVIVVDATFKLNTPVAGTVKVRGDGPGAFDFPETEALVLGNQIIVQGLKATQAFADEVRYFQDFAINWEVSIGDAPWQSAGTSTNTVYVSATPPQTDNVFHTVVDLAVRPNNGTPVEDRGQLVDASWAVFATLSVQRIDNAPLQYYGDLNRDLLPLVTGTRELLAAQNGQCNAWVKFFLDTLAVNGVTESHSHVTVYPKNPFEWILIKEWAFVEENSGDPRYPYLNGILTDGKQNWPIVGVVESQGIAGQGPTPNPRPEQGIFANHQVAYIQGVYYDPSYGLTYDSPSDMEDRLIAGFARNASQPYFEARSGRDINGDNDYSDRFTVVGDRLLIRKNLPGIVDLESDNGGTYPSQVAPTTTRSFPYPPEIVGPADQKEAVSAPALQFALSLLRLDGHPKKFAEVPMVADRSTLVAARTESPAAKLPEAIASQHRPGTAVIVCNVRSVRQPVITTSLSLWSDVLLQVSFENEGTLDV